MTWLAADSIWWDGRLHTGSATGSPPALRLAPGPPAVLPLPPGVVARRVPGTVLPGLCDAHVHSALVDLDAVRAGGIASVWDLGGEPGAVAAALTAPGMRFAGPFLIAPGGYPSDRSWAPAGSCRPVLSTADAAAAVDEAFSFGASLIKVTANAGGPMLPPATLTAVVTAAHRLGLPVVVHAEGPGTVVAAYEAGADLLAHTPWTEPADDGLLRDVAARMTWISTLDIHGWGTPTPARGTAITNLRRFLGYGGKVRYGTDLGNGPLPLGINARELRGLQDAGLSPSLILAAMTEPDQSDVSWVADGLDLTPEGFADSLATARVLEGVSR